ncbi:hypothetical protein IQ255_02105 [Pleurocapsales cyanobacterium LEGE 10410]|nr:hypothetical protein [Pleurocapsales cyanobacterium LEGE 10410]
MLFKKLNSWLRLSLRLVLTAIVCSLLFISSVNPVQAVTSDRTEGEASLNRIQAETDKAANPDASPRGIKQVTEKAQGGTNAVQGAADKGKMVKPEETSATSVKEKAASFLDNLTN